MNYKDRLFAVYDGLYATEAATLAGPRISSEHEAKQHLFFRYSDMYTEQEIAIIREKPIHVIRKSYQMTGDLQHQFFAMLEQQILKMITNWDPQWATGNSSSP